MRLKDNSVFPDICPPLLLALIVADDVYSDHGARMVVTSLKDGKHSAKSLHYAGAAADLRTRTLAQGAAAQIAEDLAGRLNHHYDVILESDHIHIEWQPRGT